MKQQLTRLFSFKNIIRLALACLIIFGAYKTFFPHKKDIMPVVLLINRYPMTPEDKQFLKNINPYGFLLSIPIHPGLKLPDTSSRRLGF